MSSSFEKLGGILFVSIPALLLLSLSFAGWDNYAQKREENEELEQRFDRLRAIADFDLSSLSTSGADNAVNTVFLGQGTPAVITATLQSKLRELAVKHGVDVNQASELVVETDKMSWHRLGVHLEMTGPMGGVLNLLQDIEAATPWLFVGNTQMRSGYAEGMQAMAEPPMSVSLDLWGVAFEPDGKAAQP